MNLPHRQWFTANLYWTSRDLADHAENKYQRREARQYQEWAARMSLEERKGRGVER